MAYSDPWSTPVTYGSTTSTPTITGSTTNAANATININGVPTPVYYNSANGQYYQVASAPSASNPTATNTGSVYGPVYTAPAPAPAPVTVAAAPTATPLPSITTTAEYKALMDAIGAQATDKYIKEAAADATLVTKYQKMVDLSSGNISLLKQRLTEDYATNTQTLKEEADKQLAREQEDLTASLRTLGAEQILKDEQLADTLNKRGIAVVQNAPGEAGVRQAATGEGRAGVEKGQLSEDFTLRREALNRTASRNVADVQTSYKRGVAKETASKTRGAEDLSYQEQSKLMDIQQQKDTAISSIAQLKQSAAIQKAQMGLQGALADKSGVVSQYSGQI